LSSLKPDYSRTAILSGRVRGAYLPAFLEFMSATAHTGTLEVEGPNEVKALVVVSSGHVKFAEIESEDGSISFGTEALRAMLRWRYAFCNVYDGYLEVAPNINGSIIGVLIEAARLEDEASRERSLPPSARIRVRNNVSAYESLGAPEMMLLSKARTGITVGELRKALPGMPVESAILELHSQGILEVEGLKAPSALNATAEFRALLVMIVPRQVPKRPMGRNAPRASTQITTVHKTVFDLINGERSAENIRNELRLSPGTMRDILQGLRSASWIEY
jgi:hypothetical protein